MVHGFPRLVTMFVVAIVLGIGVGWGAAVLVERFTGLSIGYVTAAVGGVLCTLGALLWVTLEGLDWLQIAAFRLPARPAWLPKDYKDDV
jgi:hypothetical protein